MAKHLIKELSNDIPHSMREYQLYEPEFNNKGYKVSQFDYLYAVQEYSEALNNYSHLPTTILEQIQELDLGYKLMVGFNTFIWRIK